MPSSLEDVGRRGKLPYFVHYISLKIKNWEIFSSNKVSVRGGGSELRMGNNGGLVPAVSSVLQ